MYIAFVKHLSFNLAGKENTSNLLSSRKIFSHFIDTVENLKKVSQHNIILLGLSRNIYITIHRQN